MYISFYSFAVSVLWFGIFILAISMLTDRKSFFQHFSIRFLFALLAASVARILLPVEMPYTKVIESTVIFPAILHYPREPLFHYRNLQINMIHIMIAVWLLGTGVILCRRLVEYVRFRRLLASLPDAPDRNLYSILAKADPHCRNVRIITHSSIESPSIVGLVKPVILLPCIEFDDEELLGIFIHEMSHYRFKHSILKLLLDLISAVLWWFPLCRRLFGEASYAMELQSDKAVCTELSAAQQKRYLTGLLKVVQHKCSRHPLPPSACGFMEENSDRQIVQRFTLIREKSYQKKKRLDYIGIPVVFALFLLSYSIILQPYSEPTLEDYYIDGLPNLDEAGKPAPEDGRYPFIVVSGDGYDLYNYDGSFIAHLEKIGYGLESAKIYESMEDVPK